jgi:hypothetical protein
LIAEHTHEQHQRNDGERVILFRLEQHLKDHVAVSNTVTCTI